MASISISGWSGAPNRSFTLSVVETSYDEAANTSLVTWTLTAAGSGGTWYETYLSATVNGTSVYNGTSGVVNAFPSTDGSMTGTMTISHNADGTKTIPFYIEGWCYNYVTYSNSGSLTLHANTRTAPTVGWASTPITNITVNSLTINVTSSNYCDQWDYSLNNGSWVTFATPAGDGSLSESYTITGLSVNTTYSIKVRGRRKLNQVWGISSVESAKTTGASVFTQASTVELGSTCNLKWRVYDATFKHKLKFELGEWSATYPSGSTYITSSSSGVSVSSDIWTYTGYTIPLSVANQLPSSVNGTMSVTLTTYNSSNTKVGEVSVKTFTVTIPTDVKPTNVSATLAEGNSSLPSDFSGKWVKTLSKVNATISETIAYSSPIVSRTLTVLNKSYTANNSGVATSDTLTKYGTVAVYATSKDQRGRQTTQGQNITVYNYWKPTISLSITISGDTVTTTATWSIAEVGNSNKKKLTFTRKKLSNNTTTTYRSNYTVSSYSGSDTWTQTLSDVDTETYEYTATITDSVQTVSTKRQTAIICISRLRGGKGVTFFGEAQNEGIWIVNGGNYVELDYIVDQGTSGIWTYRKWKSGTAECWGQANVSVTSWSSFGNCYEGLPGAGVQSYPTSLFIAAPTLNYSITRNDGAPAIISIEASTGASSSQTPNLYPIRPSSSSTTGNNLYVMQYYAIGRWKS